MRTAIIVQARMGSSRLPGKALLALRGRPMLTHVLERACAVEGAMVVLATSTNPRDTALVPLARAVGVDVWRGSEWDVLGRFYEAACATKADALVRITGDCPFLDPVIVQEVVAAYASTEAEYVSNDTTCSGYPDGVDVEVFSFAALEAAALISVRREDREHVTPWIRRERRSGVVMCAQGDFSSHKLSVDRSEDYDYACAVYRHLAPGFFALSATLAACELVDRAHGVCHGRRVACD